MDDSFLTALSISVLLVTFLIFGIGGILYEANDCTTVAKNNRHYIVCDSSLEPIDINGQIYYVKDCVEKEAGYWRCDEVNFVN